MSDQISMIYSAWYFYFEEERQYLQPKAPRIPVGLVLFSERDKRVNLYRLNVPEKYELYFNFTFSKVQNWIDKQIIPIKFDEEENRFVTTSDKDGTHFEPWTEGFWEQVKKLLHHNIRIEKFQ